ncbi:AIR synthase-related protein [Blautia sp. HCP3S3_H10_1]|uniref:AIR synthase-related protein n=1 Tax=unclassified Blautia TaxID=2648079 RepID=UPI003F908320|nr:AIR synthase-related protein [Clostridia bacterium]
MRLGKEAMEALQAEICGLLAPGNELVVAGAVALKGTARIAKEKYDILREHFSESFLREARNLEVLYGISALDQVKGQPFEEGTVWKAARAAGATAMYAMGDGGFLSALWKMAEASQVGLEMEFTKVPIRQETIEICEIFDLNPYKLDAGGAVLIGIPAGEALVQELRREGIMAAVIGQTNPGNDRMLYYNGNGRYLERPGKDELYKVLPMQAGRIQNRRT